jgi:hypothetical protein
VPVDCAQTAPETVATARTVAAVPCGTEFDNSAGLENANSLPHNLMITPVNDAKFGRAAFKKEKQNISLKPEKQCSAHNNLKNAVVRPQFPAPEKRRVVRSYSSPDFW